MSTSGKLSIEEGTVSVVVPSGAPVDAAVLDTIAAFELPAEQANVYLGPQESGRGKMTLTVSLPPEVMLHLGLRILEVSGTPAFNQFQWLEIATALEARATNVPIAVAEHLTNYARSIRAAYET